MFWFVAEAKYIYYNILDIWMHRRLLIPSNTKVPISQFDEVYSNVSSTISIEISSNFAAIKDAFWSPTTHRHSVDYVELSRIMIRMIHHSHLIHKATFKKPNFLTLFFSRKCLIILSRELASSLAILRISLIETETESGKESKGDINISVLVIGNVCYCDWGSKWNSVA